MAASTLQPTILLNDQFFLRMLAAWLSIILSPSLLIAEPIDLERHEVYFLKSLSLQLSIEQVKSWLSHLKGFDASIPQHIGKGAKKIVIHHDADGDDDGTYEKFEINVNEPEGREELETNESENDSITGVENILSRNRTLDRFDVIQRNRPRDILK